MIIATLAGGLLRQRSPKLQNELRWSPGGCHYRIGAVPQPNDGSNDHSSITLVTTPHIKPSGWPKTLGHRCGSEAGFRSSISRARTFPALHWIQRPWSGRTQHPPTATISIPPGESRHVDVGALRWQEPIEAIPQEGSLGCRVELQVLPKPSSDRDRLQSGPYSTGAVPVSQGRSGQALSAFTKPEGRVAFWKCCLAGLLSSRFEARAPVGSGRRQVSEPSPIATRCGRLQRHRCALEGQHPFCALIP